MVGKRPRREGPQQEVRVVEPCLVQNRQVVVLESGDGTRVESIRDFCPH